MKSLLLKAGVILLMAQSSHAIILAPLENECLNNEPVLCGILITFSLPTLILEGQEIDLGSSEAGARLDLESQGLADKQLINLIAHETQTSEQAVTAEILKLKAKSQDVSVAAVIQGLIKK